LAGKPGKLNLYLEIGAARGESLAAAMEIMAETGCDWAVLAADIPGGWEYNADALRQNIGKQLGILAGTPELLMVESGKASVCISEGGGKDVIAWMKAQGLFAALVFIDGCHEQECAKSDFEAVEPVTLAGSVVMFHDSGECDEGGLQPHLHKGCGVRSALHSLDLLPCTRMGWMLLTDTPKTQAGMTIFRRVE